MPCFLMIQRPIPDDNHSRKQCEMLHKFKSGNKKKKTGLRFLGENFQISLVNSCWKPSHTLFNLMNKCRLGADESIYLLSGTPRLAVQLFYLCSPWQNKAPRWLHGQRLQPKSSVCVLLRAPLWGHTGLAERGAELRATALSRCFPQMSCTVMHCGALQMYFCCSRFISFQDQVCAASTRNLVCV